MDVLTSALTIALRTRSCSGASVNTCIICIYAYIHTYACMHVCMYLSMYVCIYVCIRVYVCICTYVLRPNSPTHTIYYVLTL